MPFYEYALADGDGCPHCRSGFTVLQRLSDQPLKVCPKCDGAVRRVISAPNVVSGQAHKLKESNLDKAGFTQYRKVGKGVYERTAGKQGPAILDAGD